MPDATFESVLDGEAITHQENWACCCLVWRMIPNPTLVAVLPNRNILRPLFERKTSTMVILNKAHRHLIYYCIAQWMFDFAYLSIPEAINIIKGNN
jgi:hypothetical protein